MENRIQIQDALPDVWKAMYALAGSIAGTSSLPKIQLELIKTRASQINNCSFCIDMHTKDALKSGESNQRLFLLSAWKETGLFSEEEKVLLTMTEEITLIHQQGLTAATYKKARELFPEEVIAQIIMSIVMINAWNRVAVSTHMPLGK